MKMSPHGAVVHLRGAVEHVDRLAELRAQVLGRLGLPGARGAGGGGAEREPAGLRGRDVDAVREGRDDEAGAVAEVLVPVGEHGVADLDAAVVDVGVPVGAELAAPLEARDVGLAGLDDAVDDVARVRVDGDHVHDLLALDLGELPARDLDQLGELLDLELVVGLHGAGVRPQLGEGLLGPPGTRRSG